MWKLVRVSSRDHGKSNWELKEGLRVRPQVLLHVKYHAKRVCHSTILVIWFTNKPFFFVFGARISYNTSLCHGYPQDYAETSITLWNCSGTRSKGAWIVPGLPSWPQAAIWSSPLLSRKKTVQPASAKRFRNSIILSSLVGLNREPLWGLNEMRLILHGMPLTRLISRLASSLLQKVINAESQTKTSTYTINIQMLFKTR